MKFKLFTYTIGILLIGISGQLFAQVKSNFNNNIQISSKGKFDQNFTPPRPFIIPARDIKALLDKEAAENQSPEGKPYKIAEPIKVNIDVINQSQWTEDNTYVYGKFTILAAGAKSISINFDQFQLPVGSELYLYSENGEMITGPITENENNDKKIWGSWVYKGGMLTAELKCPIQKKSALKLHISNVAYGYKDIYGSEVANFNESSSCNINVLCPLGNGWENERNSVALILDANGSALCSGALINNTCNLNIPYFLTANHCFTANGGQNVALWRFTFQAWSSRCDPSRNAIGTTLFNGSTLRARNAGSDFCLVELNQVPPGNYGLTYSGWSRNTDGIQQTTIIHHPAGDVMKISRDSNPPIFATFGGAQSWQLVLDPRQVGVLRMVAVLGLLILIKIIE